MFKKIMITIMLQIVTQLTSKDVVEFITAQVTYLITSTLTGSEKRRSVLENVKATYPSVKSYFTRMAIEILVAQQKAQQEVK